MKKSIILSLLVLFTFVAVQAQVSGYMGKKFSLIYSPGISTPHLSTLNGTVLSTPTIHQALKLEYIFNNNSAIGVRYKLGINSAKNPEKYNVLNGFVDKHQFQSHSYGVYIKAFQRNKLAPLGYYFALGANFQQIATKNVILEDFNTSIVTKETIQKIDFNLSYTFGKNWIIGDYLLLGFEAEIATPFISYQQIASHSFSDYNGIGESVIANRFNIASELFKVSLNVGLIAF